MGDKNLNLGTINDSLGIFGMEAIASDGLFGMGEFSIRLKEESDETNGYLLSRSIEINGACATAIVLGSLLNKTYLELNEVRAEVVSALKKAVTVAKSDLSQYIIVLAA